LEHHMAGRQLSDAVAFAEAQRFAFAWLLPLGVIAVILVFNAQHKTNPATGAAKV